MEVSMSMICRLCGELNEKTGVSLKSEDRGGKYLVSIINEYLPIKIGNENNLPHTICPGCHIKLVEFVKFYKLVLTGQKKLKNLISEQVTDQSANSDGLEIIETKQLTKKKRGRPKKTAQPSLGEADHVQQLIDVNDGSFKIQNDTVQIQTKGKRIRKAPVRYEGEVLQGKELDKVLQEEGVLDEEDLSKTHTYNNLLSNIESGEMESIGRLESTEGADLGEVLVHNNCKITQRCALEFKCEACSQIYRQESKFLEHQSSHDSTQFSICAVCNEKFLSSEDLGVHQQLTKHEGQDVMIVVQQCHCGQTFKSVAELQSHISGEHPKQIECSLCKRKFRFNTGLRSHMNFAHKNDEGFGYPCDICGKKLKHPASVKYHKESEHNNRLKYVCNKCNKVFRHRQLLRRHQIVHSQSRPFKCAVCGATFKARAYLANHLTTHRGERNFTCDICKRTFAHKTSLTLHLRLHTGQKPFQCDVCKKKFAQKGNLQEHMRIHTGEKPYECEFCLKRFTTSSQHKVHVKSHKGEKPWKCDHCGKAFLYKDTWKTHVRRHKGEKPFKCNICKRKFSEHWALKKHLRLHTGEKPYKCPTCGKEFSDCSNFTKHKKTHLSKEMEHVLVKTDEPPSTFDIWTVFKTSDEGTPREKENGDLQPMLYITYPDPENPASKISEKFLMDKDAVVFKELDESEGTQVNQTELQTVDALNEMQVMDEQGNPLRFTAHDGSTVQVTTVDGKSLQLRMSNGITIPVEITTPNGETVVPALRTVDCLPSIGSDAEEVHQNIEGLEFVTDHKDIRLLAGLTETTLDFLPLT